MNLQRIDVERILTKAYNFPVVVCGDLMLDVWLSGTANRISSEAPVPVVFLENKKYAPGGAANVAANFRSMGAKVHISGMVGEDDSGKVLLELLNDSGIDTTAVISLSDRPTTTKTRVVAQNQQMIRVDEEKDCPVSENKSQEFSDKFNFVIQKSGLVCFSDYDNGVINLLPSLIEWPFFSSITAGLKPININSLEFPIYLLSFNAVEARSLGLADFEKENVEMFCHQIQRESGVSNIVITKGGDGCVLTPSSGNAKEFPVHKVEVFDITGAGDSFLAASSLACAVGESLDLSIEFGNLVAAASVQRHGVVALTPEEILEEFDRC